LTLSDGTKVALPEPLRTVLQDAAAAIADGRAVSVSRLDTVLTTQRAADLLGVTRPTLVRMLEAGEIPFTKPGRHRRVQLQDLVDFQTRQREIRRAALSAMTAEATDQDLGSPAFVDTR
jgi:excisionase family DNA binding protein